MLSLAETQKNVGIPLGDIFYWFMFWHSCFTLFYTSYVFHSIYESYFGLTVGIILVYGSRVIFKPASDLLDLFTQKLIVSKTD